MPAKRTLALVLTFCLLSATASAQITVPAQIDAHKPIVATLKAPLPPGAQLRGSWQVTGGDFVQVDANTVHVWAGPGVHTISATGVWVLTESVSLPDGKTFQALVDFGQYAYSADFTVGAAVPPVPPPVPGNRFPVIVEETANRTSQQAALWLQVREAFKARKYLILDKDNPRAEYKAYFDHASGLALPALLVIADNGALVRKGPCPTTIDAIKAQVAK